MTNIRRPSRGEVWSVRFDPAVGAEIRKVRPAVVISRGSIGRLPLRIVVPITEWKPAYGRFDWMVHLPASASSGLRKDSAADAFQVKSISEDRFVARLGELTVEEIAEVSGAVAYCVGAP